MRERVLITGGSGLIGRRLTALLAGQGYEVAWLSRGEPHQATVPVFGWNPAAHTIDRAAIEWADHVVHLAGAGVAERRWTAQRRQLILSSRVQGTRLLAEAIADAADKPSSVIAASATGRYGVDTGDRWVGENDPVGSDFLADVVRRWESEVDAIADLDVRCVTIRIGIVLSRDGGALPKIAAPFAAGLGAPVGSGKQYMSWIHIDDLCRMIAGALIDRAWSGAYNGVAPHPVTNAAFSRALARTLGKRILLPPVPSFVLQIAMGEMAGIVLGGVRASSSKAVAAGAAFDYATVQAALDALYPAQLR